MDLLQVHVEGISPLLMHNPAGMQASGGETLGRKKVDAPDIEAERGVYYTPTGLLGLPTAAFRSCVVAASKGRRIGRIGASTVLKGALFPADEWTTLTLPSGDPLNSWTVDARRAVLGTGKTAKGVVRGRPRFEEWAGAVHFEYDSDFLSPELIAELLEMGGRTVGVGDFRPEKAGPFGRFQIVAAPATPAPKRGRK